MNKARSLTEELVGALEEYGDALMVISVSKSFVKVELLRNLKIKMDFKIPNPQETSNVRKEVLL